MSELEVWRRWTMQILLGLIGLVAIGRGCLEGAFDGDEFMAAFLILGGLYLILLACGKGGS